MSIVYIVFGAVVVLVIGTFTIVNLQQRHAIAVATSTPTPGPNASAPPIQLIDGIAVGTPAFPDPLKANPHNGAPVDGVTCLTTEQVTLHIHSHLALFVDGKQLQVPAHIGIAPVPPQGCLYWIHTHDATGIIHIESPQLQAPGGNPFTLGMFFDIWGEPLTAHDVAGKRGAVMAYVNGMLWRADPRSIPLSAHQQIVLEIGKHVPPPNYDFPPGV